MTPEQVKSSYLRSLPQTVTLRRYTSVGTNRTKIEISDVRARVVGYRPNELVGTIIQGDSQAILYADDVTAGGFSSITTNDKLIVHGRELSIISVDDKTRRVQDVLIAYELAVRG